MLLRIVYEWIPWHYHHSETIATLSTDIPNETIPYPVSCILSSYAAVANRLKTLSNVWASRRSSRTGQLLVRAI